MINRLAIAVVGCLLLSGCSGPGRAVHSQCQNLKDDAYGEQWGAALSGGVGQVKADITEARYERCEEAFDLVQYQYQLQQSAQQLQQQEQAQRRHSLIMEKLNSPEMQRELRADSLKDLVSCTKGERGENLPSDVLGVVEGMCKSEIDRRVDIGKVGRASVDKMLNQGT